ncbi:hypothetical protein GCM10025791_10950 [Halioxenophilus aromaticivorans]|uniref:Uncharacterized protein n=1 Tax=Halioxenophilus aromaticivorans TaxID=1306992 RepID=A0AAV3TYX0_9ALTE
MACSNANHRKRPPPNCLTLASYNLRLVVISADVSGYICIFLVLSARLCAGSHPVQLNTGLLKPKQLKPKQLKPKHLELKHLELKHLERKSP